MSHASVIPAFRYYAFISYSHQDKTWADWLHKALENYVIPKRLVGSTTDTGTIPKRLIPIFRDREELASATDLSRKVNQALALSANLIVICSPRSAGSRWVQQEVLAFQQLGHDQRIFCLIVDGEPLASNIPGREAEECFVPALRSQADSDVLFEPIAADARADKDGRNNAKLKLIAGLLDVGYDDLKQREQHRRNQRMTIVVVAALAITTLTSILAITALIARRAAELARADAERRQQQAEDLVGFMLGDLADKLQQVSRLDIMELVDNRAMAYFEKLPTQDVTDEVLQQRAKTLEGIGSVYMDQGHLPKAMESYRAAAVISRQLADARPRDPARQIAYSRVLTFIGLVAWTQGTLDQAQQAFESAHTALWRAKQEHPDDPELLIQLVYLDNNSGNVSEARGNLAEAELQYRRMLGLCQILAKRKQVKPEWQLQLGAAHNNLGRLALMRGDLTSAISEYHADYAIESTLSEQNPQDNEQRSNLMTAHAILGRTLALVGDNPSAIQHLSQALVIGNQLQKVDPASTTTQESLALYGSQLARLRRLDGDLPAAKVLNGKSLRLFDKLVKLAPANTVWQRELAETQLEQSAQSLALGQPEAAHQQARAALNILEPLLATQPEHRATLLATVNAKLKLADTSTADAAKSLRSEALSAINQVTSGRDDPRLRALEVEAMLGLGQREQVKPLIAQLRQAGYRDKGLLILLQHEDADEPPDTAIQKHLQASLIK